MPEQFDPTTWIDRQRAGTGGNVFEDIMTESARMRRQRQGVSEDRIVQRVNRVHEIRRAASHHDRAIDPRGTQAQSFTEMVERWKGNT